jgi:organic hydroperoxide reductase OsmC/OhrA
MTELRASLRWQRTTPDFTYDGYDRGHAVRFGSGIEVPASAAEEFKGDPKRVNPEEMFVAALSSCHMLTFLAIAARKRLVVEAYEDDAVGWLEKNADGRLAMTRVVLRPRVRFAGEVSAEQLAKMHDKAHENCFIALSVKSDVTIEPVQA